LSSRIYQYLAGKMIILNARVADAPIGTDQLRYELR
jgi:hypothetical protein